MATRRRKKKCRYGLRRDGKCRKTRCSRKLTKKGYCPKAAGSTRRRKRRSTTSWRTRTRNRYWAAHGKPSAEARARYSGRSGYF